MILYKKKDGEVVSIDKVGAGDSLSGDDYLSLANTIPYTPTSDYNPATKKYVDDSLGDIGAVLDAINRINKDNDNSNDEQNTSTTGLQKEAEEWNYILDDEKKTITLWNFIGESTEVTVHNSYEIDGIKYKTKIASANDERFIDYGNYMFYDNNKIIESLIFEQGIDTTETYSMKGMFGDPAVYFGFINLKTFDISKLDTSSTTEFSGMFCNFYGKITTLDLSSFNTTKATNMSSMFSASNFTNIIIPFNTSTVEDFSGMFFDCNNIKSLDLHTFTNSYINSGGVSDPDLKFAFMFSNCENLEKVTVSSDKWEMIYQVPTLFSSSPKISNFTYI